MAVVYTEAQCLAFATQLAQANEAYHLLMTGQREVSVSYADKTVTYNQVSLGALRLYLQDLQNIVDGCSGMRTGRRLIHITPD